jgi:hypothetical protein
MEPMRKMNHIQPFIGGNIRYRLHQLRKLAASRIIQHGKNRVAQVRGFYHFCCT